MENFTNLMDALFLIMMCLWQRSNHQGKRLGHPNFKAMEVMAEKGLVLGLPSSLPCLSKVCEQCAMSKSHRLSYNRSTSRSRSALDLLHSDVHTASTLTFGG